MQSTQISIKNQNLDIQYFVRPGKNQQTILCLHGLGCAKSDFFGATEFPALNDYTIAAIDFPGHGNAQFIPHLDIDDLVEIVYLFIEQLALKKIILLGHSMGGLVAQLFAQKYPQKVKAFMSVEGNFAAEDCFFSRKVSKVDYETFTQKTMPRFMEKLRTSDNSGLQQYAQMLELYHPLQAYHSYCPTMVEYSDRGNLIDQFISLTIPKLFIYGSENSGLIYIPKLRENCEVVEITESNHFPQHDKPQEFFTAVSDFVHSLK